MRDAPRPIRSLCEDDPELEDVLEAFILGLGEQLDDLQDGVLARDWPLLRQRAEKLKLRSDELGYPALVAVLADVISAASHADDEGARKAVADLTELSQRVRRGHHSAA